MSIRQSLRACRRRTLKSIFRSKKHSTSFKVARTLHALKRRNAAIKRREGEYGSGDHVSKKQRKSEHVDSDGLDD